jgi:flagellar protein FlaD
VEKPVITFYRSENPLEKRVEALEREVALLKHRVRKLEETLQEMGIERTEEPEKALLTELDLANPKVVVILLDWVSFMLSRVGDEEIKNLVDYYVSIGWISRSVADIILKYAKGLRAESVKGYVDPEDHVKSLDYINRLREAME